VRWVEVYLERGAAPEQFYDARSGEDERRPYMAHHFWDEPWHPGAYVIRIADLDDEGFPDFTELPVVAEVREWDAGPDEAVYGDWAFWAFQFFQSGSMLSVGWPKGSRMQAKFVHCFLNSHGMSELDEFRWALRFAWNRLTIRPRIRWRQWRTR